MKPKTLQIARINTFFVHVVCDMFRDHRQNFFKDLSPILHELHVATVVHTIRARPAQKSVIVANIVRELCGAAGR